MLYQMYVSNSPTRIVNERLAVRLIQALCLTVQAFKHISTTPYLHKFLKKASCLDAEKVAR